MRKLTIVLMILTAACALAVEVQNPGFDGIVRTMPEGWQASADASEVFAVNDADGVSGSTSLRYSSEAELEETFVEQAVRLEPRTEYVLSAWFKSDGTTRPVVAVLQPEERNFVARVACDGSQAWQQARVRFNSGPVTDALIRVYGDFWPRQGKPRGESRADEARIVLASEADRRAAADRRRPPAAGRECRAGEERHLNARPPTRSPPTPRRTFHRTASTPSATSGRSSPQSAGAMIPGFDD